MAKFKQAFTCNDNYSLKLGFPSVEVTVKFGNSACCAQKSCKLSRHLVSNNVKYVYENLEF